MYSRTRSNQSGESELGPLATDLHHNRSHPNCRDPANQANLKFGYPKRVFHRPLLLKVQVKVVRAGCLITSSTPPTPISIASPSLLFFLCFPCLFVFIMNFLHSSSHCCLFVVFIGRVF